MYGKTELTLPTGIGGRGGVLPAPPRHQGAPPLLPQGGRREHQGEHHLHIQMKFYKCSTD